MYYLHWDYAKMKTDYSCYKVLHIANKPDM